jgi:Zn-dependent M28 family amino/carboxypeptidase
MVLIVLQAVFLTLHALHPTPCDLYVWFAFLLLSPVTIVIWSMLGKEVVQGAADNLSGIAVAFEVFKTLADKREKGKSVLQHTRIRFVSFGSEERGLCGSRAYAALKKRELLKENAHLLNIDNVRVASELTIIARELLSGTVHSPVLIKGLQDSFTALGLVYKMGMNPIGGSDAISLGRIGIPSVTVIAMSSKKHDFTYHTRHDIPDNIEPQALENVRDVLLDFVRKWDVR